MDFPTDWLRSEHAKSICFLLAVAVRVSQTAVLKFPNILLQDGCFNTDTATTLVALDVEGLQSLQLAAVVSRQHDGYANCFIDCNFCLQLEMALRLQPPQSCRS